MPDGVSYTVIWFILAIVLAGIEAATLGIVTIWFAIGALAAMIVSLTGLSLIFQVIAFIITSGVLLYFTRPIVKKFLVKKTQRTNSDRLIGEEGVVIEKIDPVLGKGQVKVMGQIWSARPSGSESIEVDEAVEILEISGVKLIVKNKNIEIGGI